MSTNKQTKILTILMNPFDAKRQAKEKESERTKTQNLYQFDLGFRHTVQICKSMEMWQMSGNDGIMYGEACEWTHSHENQNENGNLQ